MANLLLIGCIFQLSAELSSCFFELACLDDHGILQLQNYAGAICTGEQDTVNGRELGRTTGAESLVSVAARLRRCPFGVLLKRHCPMSTASAAPQTLARADRSAETTSQDAPVADVHCRISSSQPGTSSEVQSEKQVEGVGPSSTCAELSNKRIRLEQCTDSRAPVAELDGKGGVEFLEGFRPRHDCQQGAQVLLQQAASKFTKVACKSSWTGSLMVAVFSSRRDIL